jgi:hypothetical protein
MQTNTELTLSIFFKVHLKCHLVLKRPLSLLELGWIASSPNFQGIQLVFRYSQFIHLTEFCWAFTVCLICSGTGNTDTHETWP